MKKWYILLVLSIVAIQPICAKYGAVSNAESRRVRSELDTLMSKVHKNLAHVTFNEVRRIRDLIFALGKLDPDNAMDIQESLEGCSGFSEFEKHASKLALTKLFAQPSSERDDSWVSSVEIQLNFFNRLNSITFTDQKCKALKAQWLSMYKHFAHEYEKAVGKKFIPSEG